MSEELTIADYEQVLADHRRLVRRLDVALNGEAGAAKQASLCDIVGQLEDARPLVYDPAYLRSNGWVYQASTGYWTDRWSAVACFGWLSATLEQRRRDNHINRLPLSAAAL